MTMLEGLEISALADVMRSFRDGLRLHQDAINRLNVYPVPDGDTGTNMALTAESVVTALDEAGEHPREVFNAISRGSLMGARGNSGVILSQIMRGFISTLADAHGEDEDLAAVVIDPKLWADAVGAAARFAYEAVQRPVEGTILTVVREAAEGAAAALGDDASLIQVIDAARTQGADALERTPEMLPVLAQAGVVDAGGSGFLLLLDAFLLVLDGRPLPPAPELPEGAVITAAEVMPGEGEYSVADLRYEVMYFLEAPDDRIPAFRELWATIGDSIVVVGGEGIWNCHIHTDDIGAAIEAAIDCGRPRDIRVTDLAEQVEEERWVREATAEDQPEIVNEPVETAVVAVAAGPGVRRLLTALRVQEVVEGGQSMNPSTAQLLEAVEACQSDHVIILPNNKNIVAVAEQVDAQTSKTVRVIPTHAVPEGLAALLAYDPEGDLEQNLAGMKTAAGGVLTGELTRAVRDSTSPAGPIAIGDYIGVTANGIQAVAAEIDDAAVALLDYLVDEEDEIVTILEGEGSRPAITRRLTEWLNDNRPEVEAEVHHGGQPLYPYLFGVE